jgi:hypothetical protein
MSREWHLISRQVGRGRAVLGGVLLGALALAAIPSAGTAATTDYGWTDCNWSDLEASGGTLTWSYDSVFSMPANGSGDGVLNSFTDRVTNATARWNSALAGTPTNLHLTKVVSSLAKIVVRYQTYPPEPDTWFGTTVLTGIAPGCVLHSTANNTIYDSDIYIAQRPDWFTQNDSRRGYWEQECRAGTGTTYTCSKWYDFGSTYAHELGHALGIYTHPDLVGATATAIAMCEVVDAQGRPAWRHTMCASNSVTGSILDNKWTSERRTLEGWDVESLRLIVVNH